MSPIEGRDGGPPGTRGFDLLDGSPYRAIGVLGEGAMGEVFEAEHRTLGHRVVVKVLREPYTGRSDMRDRMRVEGQALARIRHPNLVMVTDFGQTGAGRPYIVMERLVGRSLGEELRGRPIVPVDEAAEIARQTLLGLHAAHEAGLVHRDIKPDNVFLCADAATGGRASAGGVASARGAVGAGDGGTLLVKVLDFGVVKIAQAGRDPRTPMPLLVPTADGVTVGTPRYFSPEQARGQRDLDARSDLYSVGLVLYRMVVGRGPFDEIEELGKLLQAHAITMPPAPSKVSAQPVPEELDRIVMKALLKNRDERYADALLFADDLGRFVVGLGGRRSGAPVSLPPVSRASRERAFAEAPTCPAVPAMAETAAVSAAVRAGGATGPSTPRKLSDQTVVLEGVVERVLASAPQGVPPSGGGAPSGRSSVPETAPMFEIAVPPRPPASGPGGPAPGRSSVPETVSDLQIAVGARPPVMAAPLAAPSGSPRAQPGHTVPLPTLRRPAARAVWKLPALIVIVAVVLAAIVIAVVRLFA